MCFSSLEVISTLGNFLKVANFGQLWHFWSGPERYEFGEEARSPPPLRNSGAKVLLGK